MYIRVCYIQPASDGTYNTFLCDTNNGTVSVTNYHSIDRFVHPFSFPREWIKGEGHPNGIGRNEELSERDKEHIKRLYGPPRTVGRTMMTTPTTNDKSGRDTSNPTRPTTTITRAVPTLPKRSKPVTSLPPPRSNSIYDVQVYEPHRGIYTHIVVLCICLPHCILCSNMVLCLGNMHFEGESIDLHSEFLTNLHVGHYNHNP